MPETLKPLNPLIMVTLPFRFVLFLCFVIAGIPCCLMMTFVHCLFWPREAPGVAKGFYHAVGDVWKWMVRA